ncbi:hypothetical protein WOLCODRAFT_100364 [Wolfiporia cocos MD-104 SS10]|uniref:WDR59/RTC1-like RING zinc finger domain-containing protein n=1 Tax=Wolfiporia cocos (strain MD-104) TaxID=742152 RepID=A0A2H3JN65_WOLCO|nr:hypothetical protein WOLCODRAFT_100364 [Wolfiporia cocos MD-104 SS10]
MMSSALTVRPGLIEPPSPEDDSNFRLNLTINMKDNVGDAVGNMSISPTSRDVVLATRNGLFIIDLEAPLNIPRFLPQGGTWDVADVQWNPHTSRSEYIVSTSSEKLLIWNLLLTGKTSIEHVLRSHYRAITDINWHTTEPDTVVSTGIDSWLWAWDLRATQKPVMGLCAFGPGGTQVKWNRQDGNLLASSHQKEVLLWDRRKGSLPLSTIKAHGAKIYGIDWSHDKSNELLTCSLDKSIKVWNTHDLEEPKTTITTSYPVWRARDLPFGRGLLSLPQRGETALEMYSYDHPRAPVEIFAGHTDVVKEFVWRRGGHDCTEFQLITWSKDKTMMFWPIDTDVMQKAGTKSPASPTQTDTGRPYRRDVKVSFSNPPIGTELPPALSAPVGHRGILAEVRAPQPPRATRVGIQRSTPDRDDRQIAEAKRDQTTASTKPIPIAQERGGTMTRGHLGGRSAQITTFAWLSSVKVTKRDGSSGPGSGTEGAQPSKSRPPSLMGRSVSRQAAGTRKPSEGKEKSEDEHRDTEQSQSLQDEITSVVNKLSASKVKLESASPFRYSPGYKLTSQQADLTTKKRACTFGLHGPWGDSTSVFIRITFTFPRDYPQATYPHGVPSVDLERNPLISIKNRAFILRRLRTIREHERPCLEKCLRFLLFGDEEERLARHMRMDSESSSDEESRPVGRLRRSASFTLLRNDKNLAEPRTSQGVFCQLVCFSRAPPRIVRNVMPELAVSPSVASRNADSTSHLFASPVLLSNAVRRLSEVANDRDTEYEETRPADDASNILRIMTNLFTFSQHRSIGRRVSENTRQVDDIPTNYSLLPTRRSQVSIRDTALLVGIDIVAARDYTVGTLDPVSLCKKNAEIARERGRVDHERIFTILEAVLTNAVRSDKTECGLPRINVSKDTMALQTIARLYEQLSATKDIQMLAMLSMLLLRTSSSRNSTMAPTPDLETPDLRPSLTRRKPSLSPIWSQASQSPTFQPVAPAMDSPTSSKGSWSSLFNANSMRQIVTGPKYRMSIPIHENVRIGRDSPSPSAGRSRDSSAQPTPSTTKSWAEALTPAAGSTVTFTSAAHSRRPTFSQVVMSQHVALNTKRVVIKLKQEIRPPLGVFQSSVRIQLLCHILVYAELLLAWELPLKRAELLKAVEGEIHSTPMNSTIIESTLGADVIGCVPICEHSTDDSMSSTSSCVPCAGRMSVARCSVCRLPVRGLSHTCVLCQHVAHVKCWEGRREMTCATGCGCSCTLTSATLSATSIKQSLSPLRIWHDSFG